MSYTIAMAGKGGTGKSTTATLIIRYITEELGKTVLAVDADPNSTLGISLGVEVNGTIADIRDDVVEKRADIPATMSKDRYIEYRIEECIIEENKFDLLTMGRPEGPKCYCYANNLLRKYLDKAEQSYPYIIIDTEAGMEHLSRRTTNDVDLLIIAFESTIIGVHTANRITELIESLPIKIKKTVYVMCKVPAKGVSEKVDAEVSKFGIEVSTKLPFDEEIYDHITSGDSLLDISPENAVYSEIKNLMDKFVTITSDK
ncbi:nickel insertase AcsF of CODH/ACS complex [Candidatus Scalindua japonica]|uniref:Nickel insertase AcsF of CODH/ACS complex n=1 Tax=Candidatus Scalindua japonica TaxID=1284222 RepID=A0A286TV82_9BACT|nr:AAA family ATPase [Candidatus Scalindua japonica]GAX59751.1 nickel insertase AcsF of CODH/ACS complex [Candidatus Scalindua japonica]